MKAVNLLLISVFLTAVYSCSNEKSESVSVAFPKVSLPIQITDDSKEHFFASYYGINSFDGSERYVTVLQTDLKCFCLKMRTSHCFVIFSTNDIVYKLLKFRGVVLARHEAIFRYSMFSV